MKSYFVRSLILIMICSWLALMQPGMSVFWLIAPAIHARIDADEYGQTIDGRPLPDRPVRPPHSHPSDDAFPNSAVSPLTGFDRTFYQTLFSPAGRPSLNGERAETSVTAQSIALAPPDHPPRA